MDRLFDIPDGRPPAVQAPKTPGGSPRRRLEPAPPPPRSTVCKRCQRELAPEDDLNPLEGSRSTGCRVCNVAYDERTTREIALACEIKLTKVLGRLAAVEQGVPTCARVA